MRCLRFGARVAPFWLRAPLYRWMPGGFGYYRRLRRCGDPSYEWERDRHPVRAKHRGARLLAEPDGEGFVRRRYASYEEYVVHQRQKLEEILVSGGFANASVSAYRRRFYRRFRHLIRRLPADAVIVCLGARQGTEVEVLRELGFRNAYGIDLNPGPENPLVQEGDFNRIDAADDSVDLVYSNSLDHAFDLDRFFAEHRRVLKPDGFALYDIHTAYQPGEKAAFEATLWTRQEHVVKRALDHFRRILKLEAAGDWTWLLLQQPNPVATPVPVARSRSRPGTAQSARLPARRARQHLKLVAFAAVALFAIFALLPEALGDRPYDVFGHHHFATHHPNQPQPIGFRSAAAEPE
jgi:SAM-dependent methyltransferase